MTPGERLKRARQRQKLSVADLAQGCGMGQSAIRAHEANQNAIKPETAEAYAAALGTTPEYILFGRTEATIQGLRLLVVSGELRTGAWVEATSPVFTFEADLIPFLDQQYARSPNLYALKVVDTSMNRLYNPPGWVVVVPVEEAGLVEGDHAIVRRTREDLVELTLREVVLQGDEIQLWPRSTEEHYQTPFIVRPGDAEVEIEILGIVAGAYKRGPARTGPRIY